VKGKLAPKENKLIFRKEIIILIIGTLLGALISFCATGFWEYNKENKRKHILVKLIHYDINIKVATLLTRIKNIPHENAIKKLINNSGQISNEYYETEIMDHYIDDIMLFPYGPGSEILSFYNRIKAINSGIKILEIDNKMDKDAKIHWIDQIYSRIYAAIKSGKKVLLYIEAEYKIDMEPFRGIKERNEKIEKELITEYPNLKDKLSLEFITKEDLILVQ
jgi:hypothetical protein